MKIFLAIFIAVFIVGCEKKATFGFTSSDCNEVYSICLNKCTQSGKSRADCLQSCERSRGMCNAVKTKGCMQNCNKSYGKNTPSAESCKRQCAENAR
ncbi:hypothetical protein [Helicobacter sp. 23-1045]